MRRLAAVVALPFLLAGPLAVLGSVGAVTRVPVASDLALGDIPSAMLALYQRAALTCPGLPWTVLAAVGKIESDHGRSVAPGVVVGANEAGARGPMQFLPRTFAAYGVDADGDGLANPYSPADAVFAAARLLCADGGGSPAGLPDALYAYNHDQAYVDEVLGQAARYEVPVGQAAAAQVVLTSPRITLSPAARADLLAGLVDPRVVDLLATMSRTHTLAAGVLRSGHSEYVKGTTRVSNHFHGRAVDIAVIDGNAVSPASAAALAVVLEVAALPPPLRPDEVGSPFAVAAPGFFTDGDHQDHLHLGYDAPPG